MTLQNPQLQYKYGDLSPLLSEDEVRLHYSKHTQAYYDTTNELIKGTVYEDKPLDKLINKNTMVRMGAKLFNNVCQAYNHSFYWNCLIPEKQSGKPSTALEEAIKDDFETFDKFKQTFFDAAINHFGSGWVWLYYKNNRLYIKATPNAGNPLTGDDQIPLLNCDVWEHAWCYDPQYAAKKKEYVHAYWKLINWEFVSENFDAAVKGNK